MAAVQTRPLSRRTLSGRAREPRGGGGEQPHSIGRDAKDLYNGGHVERVGWGSKEGRPASPAIECICQGVKGALWAIGLYLLSKFHKDLSLKVSL